MSLQNQVVTSIGAVLFYKGQSYKVVGLVPHRTYDGRVLDLVELSTHCAECAVEFTTRVPADRPFVAASRRCKTHRKPGVRV